MSDSMASDVSACRPPIRGRCSPTLQLQEASLSSKHAWHFFPYVQKKLRYFVLAHMHCISIDSMFFVLRTDSACIYSLPCSHRHEVCHVAFWRLHEDKTCPACT